MGAHTAGEAGKRLNGLVGRITGRWRCRLGTQEAEGEGQRKPGPLHCLRAPLLIFWELILGGAFI